MMPRPMLFVFPPDMFIQISDGYIIFDTPMLVFFSKDEKTIREIYEDVIAQYNSFAENLLVIDLPKATRKLMDWLKKGYKARVAINAFLINGLFNEKIHMYRADTRSGYWLIFSLYKVDDEEAAEIIKQCIDRVKIEGEIENERKG